MEIYFLKLVQEELVKQCGKKKKKLKSQCNQWEALYKINKVITLKLTKIRPLLPPVN